MWVEDDDTDYEVGESRLMPPARNRRRILEEDDEARIDSDEEARIDSAKEGGIDSDKEGSVDGESTSNKDGDYSSDEIEMESTLDGPTLSQRKHNFFESNQKHKQLQKDLELHPKNVLKKGKCDPAIEVNWRRYVDTRLKSQSRCHDLMIAILSCSSSAAKSMWQKKSTPFFIAAGAIGVEVYSFVTNNEHAEMKYVPTGAVESNNFKVPGICNMAAHLVPCLLEANEVVNTEFVSICKTIEKRHKYNGIPVAFMPSFKEAAGLVASCNFTRRILHNLWYAWPDAETKDVRAEVVAWMAANLTEQKQLFPSKIAGRKKWRSYSNQNSDR